MFVIHKKHVLKPKNLELLFKSANKLILIYYLGYKQFRLIETRTQLLFTKSRV